VPNGIDPAKFVALPAREASDGPVVLGFVGFVRDWHGLDAVIAAMAADRDGPKVRLVVVGDGPARPILAQQAVALGLGERVTFTGLQPREAIPALIAGFDIALQPLVVRYEHPRSAARRGDRAVVFSRRSGRDVARCSPAGRRCGIAAAARGGRPGRDRTAGLHVARECRADRGMGEGAIFPCAGGLILL
jgi:glycosyltransferase involved in cell wall biosynthesis